MTVDDFKRIFYMEYYHRYEEAIWSSTILTLWSSIAGRMVGMIYLVPAVALYRMGWIAQKYRNRLIAFAGLIAFQVWH